jgi:hypothetical protein
MNRVRVWKEVVAAYFNVLPRHSHGKMEENHESPHTG